MMYYNISHLLELKMIIEVKEVHWTNDGIGCYDCGGATGIDKGKNYIEQIDIEKISLCSPNNKIIEITKDQKELFNFFENLIINDSTFIENITTKEIKENESIKLERKLSLLNQ